LSDRNGLGDGLDKLIMSFQLVTFLYSCLHTNCKLWNNIWFKQTIIQLKTSTRRKKMHII